MPVSRIRGGTPISHHGEQHSINDPDLLARIDRNARLFQAWEEERLQAAIDAEKAAYQPPPDIDTSDRGISPLPGGLPSPAASPTRDVSQLHGRQSSPPIVSISNKPSMCIVTRGAKANDKRLRRPQLHNTPAHRFLEHSPTARLCLHP